MSDPTYNLDVDLDQLVREIPDFPTPGVVFKDITPVLGSPEAFAELIRVLAEPFRDQGITKVAGIEARGFTVAAPMALELDAGFVPIRKRGKLPYETVSEEYELEYGTDTLEVHVDAFEKGEKVLLVDDVIATGGTAAAAVTLLRTLGVDVAGIAVFIELIFLGGRKALDDVPIHAILGYD